MWVVATIDKNKNRQIDGARKYREFKIGKQNGRYI